MAGAVAVVLGVEEVVTAQAMAAASSSEVAQCLVGQSNVAKGGVLEVEVVVSPGLDACVESWHALWYYTDTA